VCGCKASAAWGPAWLVVPSTALQAVLIPDLHQSCIVSVPLHSKRHVDNITYWGINLYAEIYVNYSLAANSCLFSLLASRYRRLLSNVSTICPCQCPLTCLTHLTLPAQLHGSTSNTRQASELQHTMLQRPHCLARFTTIF